MNETCAYECLCLGMHECVLGRAVIVFVKVHIWRYLELRYEGLGRDKSDRHQCVGSDTWAARIAARPTAAGKFASWDCTLLTCGCLCHLLCLACASRVHTSYLSISVQDHIM